MDGEKARRKEGKGTVTSDSFCFWNEGPPILLTSWPARREGRRKLYTRLGHLSICSRDTHPRQREETMRRTKEDRIKTTSSLRSPSPQLILPALSDIMTPSWVSSSSRPFPSPSLSSTRSYASATMDGWMGTLFFASMRMMLETRAMERRVSGGMT